MRRVIGLIVLTVGLGVLGASSFAPAEAQDKDAKAKKMKDKDKKDKAGAGGNIEIYKAKDGFRYRIKDADGNTIAMPARGHKTRAEVLKDLEEVKAILAKARPTEVKD